MSWIAIKDLFLSLTVLIVRHLGDELLVVLVGRDDIGVGEGRERAHEDSVEVGVPAPVEIDES